MIMAEPGDELIHPGPWRLSFILSAWDNLSGF